MRVYMCPDWELSEIMAEVSFCCYEMLYYLLLDWLLSMQIKNNDHEFNNLILQVDGDFCGKWNVNLNIAILL